MKEWLTKNPGTGRAGPALKHSNCHSVIMSPNVTNSACCNKLPEQGSRVMTISMHIILWSSRKCASNCFIRPKTDEHLYALQVSSIYQLHREYTATKFGKETDHVKWTLKTERSNWTATPSQSCQKIIPSSAIRIIWAHARSTTTLLFVHWRRHDPPTRDNVSISQSVCE